MDPQSWPIWFRIIKSYPNNQHGPSVAFVFGAMREDPAKAPASADAGKEELRALLRRIDSEAPQGYGVRVEWCAPKLQAHILREVEGGKGLTWKDMHGEDVPDIDALTDVLWKRYGVRLLAAEYSKDGDWHKFTDKELETIAAFFSSPTYPF